MESLPPAPPLIASATSLIILSEDIPDFLKKRLFILLEIKHDVQDDAQLTQFLNLLIDEIIQTNQSEIDSNLQYYPLMVKNAFRSSIKKYFIDNIDQVKKTKHYRSIYNTTWSSFADNLLKKVQEQYQPVTSSFSSVASSSAIYASDNERTLSDYDNSDDSVESESESKSGNQPLPKRRKIVEFREDFRLYTLAKVALQDTFF
jgi:hypothetical protein